MGNVLEFFVKMKDMMSGGLVKLAQQSQTSFNKVQSDINRTMVLNTKLAGSFDAVDAKARSSGNSLAAWSKGIGAAAAAFGAFSMAGNMLQQGLQAQARQASFEVMAGKEGGTRLNQNITKFAQDSIYGNELYQNAQTMMGFGMKEKEIMPGLKMLGDVAMGDSNKLNSLTLAFSQVQAAGKLTGQDLLQFINAGFNPLNEISKQTGISIGDLKKKMEDGAISAGMITSAFQSATGKGGSFYQMTEKIAATDFGKWQAFQGQLEGVTTQIGGALAPAFGTLVGWLSNTVSWLQQNWDWVGAVATVVGTLATGLGIVTAATTAWTWAVGIFNAVLAMNPIVLVVAAVAALTAGIVYAYNKFGWFRGAVLATWETIKGFGGVIKEYVVDRIQGILSGLGGLASAISKFFDGDWQGAWSTAKLAVNDLVGLDAKNGAINRMREVGKAASAAYQTGFGEIYANSSKKSTSVSAGNIAGHGPAGAQGVVENIIKGGDGGRAKQSANAGNGGSKVVNITVKSLIEKLEIVNNGSRAIADDVKDQVEQALLRLLNSGALLSE